MQNSDSEQTCRWNSYGSYKLLLLAWMMNEGSLCSAVTDISHRSYYMHSIIFTLSVIFIGIPLVYSEVCIAQYTNCDLGTMWNYFPLLRSVKYATIYLVLMKTLYSIVMCSWYLVYTFFSALDPPPWFSCDDYNTTKCMVKRINVSIFQHCLDAQNMFDDDCGMKTASSFFFEREIGDNCTGLGITCLYPWKPMAACICIAFSIFLLSIKKFRYLKIVVRLSIAYMSIVMFVMFCVSMSTSGSWCASKVTINWSNYGFDTCSTTVLQGFLFLGTGHGMVVYLTSDVSFRSPATMTSVSVSLISLSISLILSLVTFSGIKTMSYFHGEEENVIEIGDSLFFQQFASTTEILSYFDSMPIWGFLWFSAIFLAMFVNLWLILTFLKDSLLGNTFLTQKYNNSCSFLFLFLLCVLTLPFFCSDLCAALRDATEFIQLLNSLFFSVTLYWIYGFNTHNVDIIFMIGVKASYYWKITWLLNPIFLSILIYSKWTYFGVFQYEDTYYVTSVNLGTNALLLYTLIAIYFFIIFVGMLKELFIFYRHDDIRNVVFPTANWGPQDRVLFKSRLVFVPQLMTTEFLYRQVRIHGYGQKTRTVSRKVSRVLSEESSSEKMEWSALTSN